MPESTPSWMSQQRTLLPQHLTPGTARSSFARPEEYKVHRPTYTNTTAPDQSRQRTGFAAKPRTKSKASNITTDSNELPPTNSIHGVQSADSESCNTSSIPVSANTFQRGPVTGIPVIVFGFPPGSTQQVLQNFSKFGDVMENVSTIDSQQSANPNSSTSFAAPAIECGRNWLRITYRGKESAARALAQNGSVMPGQYVIGCVLAEPGEYTNQMQQSSTNSLLMDDSDVSLIQDHSLTNYMDTDRSTDGNLSNATTTTTNQNTNTNTNANSASASNNNNNTSTSILPEKIVLKEADHSLFNTHAHHNSKPIGHPQPQIGEIKSTKLPNTESPQSVLGKVAKKITDSIFGWDV